MKKIFISIMITAVVSYFIPPVYSAEHGGKEHAGIALAEKEHGGKEHAGMTFAEKEHGGKEHAGVSTEGKEHAGSGITEPTADDIRSAMKGYVESQSARTGTFDIYDPETKSTRRLSLIRIHERVGKTGEYFYSCADFKDVDTGDMLDLDLDVEHKGGRLNVVDVRIHKLNGKRRYTYDENDNRIPISN